MHNLLSQAVFGEIYEREKISDGSFGEFGPSATLMRIFLEHFRSAEQRSGSHCIQWISPSASKYAASSGNRPRYRDQRSRNARRWVGFDHESFPSSQGR
jgi:hypothetical protein